MTIEIIKPGYRRVSELLAPLQDFSMIDPSVLENKARIGTNVHGAVYLFENDVFIPVSEDEEPYFKGYLNWREENDVTFERMEERLYSDRYMVTGRLDAVIRFPGSNDLVLLDFN